MNIPDEEYSNLLVERVVVRVDEKTRARDARWRGVYAAVFTILTILGYANLSNLSDQLKLSILTDVRKDLNKEVKTEVFEATQKIVDDRLGQSEKIVTNEMTILRLVAVAKKLEDADSIAGPDRDIFLAYLKQVVNQIPTYTSNPEIINAIDLGLSAFFEAELEVEVDQIDEIIKDELIKSQSIVLTMITHYGRKIAGKAIITDDYVRKYRRYASASKQTKTDDLATVYDLIFEFRVGGLAKNERCDELYADIMNMSDIQKKTVETTFDFLYKSESIGGPENARISSITRKLLETYDLSVALPDCFVCKSI